MKMLTLSPLAIYAKRLRKLTIRRDRGTPIRCRVCAIQWLPGDQERHKSDCPVLTLTCEAIKAGFPIPEPQRT